MRYIRRKDNPLFIKAFGFVNRGGLGDFDDTIYEEIEGHLPDGFQIETPEQEDAAMDVLIQAVYALLPDGDLKSRLARFLKQ